MLVSVSLLAASGALRVASLNLCTDEYLLLLARPGEIVSVSRLARDPADSSLWRRARNYPANRGSLESVLTQRPTLILSMGGGGRATSLIAGRLGIRTIDLGFPADIAGVEAAMIKVATALGDPARAAGWRRRLDRLRANRPPLRDTIYLTDGGNSIAADGLGAQWMRLAGFEQRALTGGRATLETLAVRPPQVLLRSTYRRAELSLGQRWLGHPLVKRLADRRVDTDGRPWTCAGPLMVDEIERLQSLR